MPSVISTIAAYAAEMPQPNSHTKVGTVIRSFY
jgi:hypothetical protein